MNCVLYAALYLLNMIFIFCMLFMQATKKLRSMGIESMIVGASSCNRDAEKQEFIEAGLNDYQVKPLTLEVLKSILDVVKASK